MSNAQKSTPPVPPGGININGTVENNVVRVNVALARVYHALKENATMPSAVRKKMGVSVEEEAPKDKPAKILFTQHRLGTMEKYHAS